MGVARVGYGWDDYACTSRTGGIVEKITIFDNTTTIPFDMIPSFNKLQKEKAYLTELHEASLPVLSEKPEIGIAIDFEEYIDCKRHLQFECSLFQELKQYWQGASEEEKVEWLKFDLFRPILRCMNLLRDHHSWEESHDDYTFVVSEDNLKKEQLDSDQLFELLSWYGEDTINGLLKQSITSPVIRRKIRDALKEHKFEAFESALLEAGDSLGGFYEVATIYCSYFPPTPPIDRIEAVDVEKLSPEDLAKMAKFPTNILKPKDEKTQKMVTGLEGLLSELVSNNCIWDHIVSLLAFIRITTLSVEEQQILSVFYDSPLYPTISDDCDSYVKKLKEVLADKYQVSEETKSFHNPGLPDVHVSDENLDGANPKRQGGGQEEYVLHWPTDEELLGYQNNFNADNFYTGTIFGAAGFVKASDIKNLLEVLSSEHILLWR